MNFVIDKSKWRCGGNEDMKYGHGETLLLNNQGYMCCLGQIGLQLGCTPNDIKYCTAPEEVSKLKNTILCYHNYNSRLSSVAIDINDNPNTTVTQKEKKIISLFKQYGHKIKFVNKTKELKKGKIMSRKTMLVNVRGVARKVYLTKELSKNKWRAQVYINDGSFRTSVTGVLSVNTNGVKRFVPSANAVNADLL